MNISLIILFILQVLLIIILANLLYILFKESRTLSFEDRLSNYSIASVDEQNIPIFERLYNKLWKTIRNLNRLFEKSEIIKKYCKRLNKYINNKEKNPFDYISIKFLVSIFFGLLYVISSIMNKNYNIMFLIFVMILSFFIVDIYLIIDFKRKRKQIEHDLLNAIIIMNNAFISGMNITQAVEVVSNELTGPIQEEFKKISLDISYGLSLEVVFNRFYERVKIEDIKYITSSLSLINKTGGNIVKVFKSIEKNFYDKKKLIDEMNSLTSSSSFMFKLLCILPLILCLILFILNKEFFIPLITTSLGRILILVIISLFAIYVCVVKKIMKVDV